MRLINADALIEDLKYDVELDARTLDDTDLSFGRNRELVQYDKDCKQNMVDILKNAPTVDAVPIEWINQRVKGLKIQLINADEDDVDLIWYLRDEIQTLTELIDYWKEEQEKQNDS